MPYKAATILTIILLVGTIFFGPLIGLIGVILMWLYIKWPKWLKILITTLIALYLLLILFVIINASLIFFYRPVKVRGEAMSPTYKNNQFLITKTYDKNSQLNRGDIIILKAINKPDLEYIKRVVGVPGDQIEITEGKVYLNDNILNEDYLPKGTITNHWENGFTQEGQKIIVPADSYFVMGDNRLKSSDSREWGFIPKNNVLNKVMFCYWNCN